MPAVDPSDFRQAPPQVIADLTSPLGATRRGAAVEFAVVAGGAEVVDLCLYSLEDPETEIARVRMQRTERGIWRTRIEPVPAGLCYGYRAHGPWDPKHRLRYNAKKLLLDPYARVVVGEACSRLDMLTMPSPQQAPGTTDNGSTALKSAIVDDGFDWGADAAPRTPWRDTVIYEAHVKGFTKRHPKIPEALRGTYAGLAHPAAIQYLKDLGVTAIQLLPVHQHLEDGFLIDRGLVNYWGYNTIGYFAPHADYAASTAPQEILAEFKGMVKHLHAAGIEVILDVVYNHTAEGNEFGPSILFRGLDNAQYYQFIDTPEGPAYHNVTGCGNAVASFRPAALQLHLDSLRYWVEEMHIDGFRFDLAVTTARSARGYDREGPFLTAIAQDPVLSRVKLIAEPWDVGEMDSYQVGNFPAPWRELNGRFRDHTRRFWRSDPGTLPDFSKSFCGSAELYQWDHRPPTASINFITSHDGFTLRDLVSYVEKHNEANGENNRDGDSESHSSNAGVEGETRDFKVLEVRRRRARCFLASMICAKGVPFLTAGDERWRTQKGNNNAYCQDNEISWLDWKDTKPARMMLKFTRQMLAFRRETEALRDPQFFTGARDPLHDVPDVTWLDSDGSLLSHEEWHDAERVTFGMMVRSDRPLLFFFNHQEDDQEVTLPGADPFHWEPLFDTTLDDAFAPEPLSAEGLDPENGTLQLPAISILCFQLRDGAPIPRVED